MRRFFPLIMTILFSAVPFLWAEDTSLIVKQIKITGNKNISKELIRSLIETREGEEISLDKLSKDIKELYNSTGAFSNIMVDVQPVDGGLSVEYKVIENPKIKSIKIEGNKAIKEKEIRDKISISPGEFFHEKTVWDNKQRILQLYRDKGFYNAKVDTRTKKNQDGTVDLIFAISEGEKVKVENVKLLGNKGLSDRAIRKVMQTRAGKYLRDSVLEEDVRKIEQLYRDKGFIFATVKKVEKKFSPDNRKVTVEITIDEGKQFRIGRYDLDVVSQGKRIFSDDKIRSHLNLDVGDIFSQSKFQEDIAKLQQAYIDEGYITAEITPDIRFREDKGLVDITLKINEGGQVLINKVVITGLEKTKDEVIRRELDRLDIKPGKPFNVKNIRKARQRIISLGPFIKGVDFIPGGSGKGNRKDLIVQIVESPQMGSFGIGGGYSSQDGLFGFAEIGHNNLLGRAYRLYFKGEVGIRNRKIARFTFDTPWILNTPTSLNISLYSTQRQRYLYYYYSNRRDRSYTDKRYGGTITLGRSLTRNLNVAIRLKDEMVSTEVPYELKDVYQGVERRETRSMTFYLTRDTRDYLSSMFDPSGGSYNDLSVEFSGGLLGSGERINRFQRYTYEGSWFVNPFWKFVFAAHLKVGYLRAGSLKTPEDKQRQLGLIYERYFLGGADTVRGYDDFTIVPPGNEYISSAWGGNKMYYLNLEWRFPIVEAIRGLVFFDMGQTWNENTGTLKALLDDFKPRRSIGVGVRFEMFGMLARLEYGYALDRDLGHGKLAPKGKFHFTIGPGF
ncbi:TPA: outer membrane protein assembly factor BamA [Candidatus Poribacteria bacterium]|nr:outer membrane protein assembly factor BamA [Candidatus Poribacteria bacterium]HEX28629.1 outer membrane protein assembly factor BamA [Candidatus Poribacteria bacterium]